MKINFMLVDEGLGNAFQSGEIKTQYDPRDLGKVNIFPVVGSSMTMSGEITTLFGMKVFTDEGRYVGKIEDVVIDTKSNAISGIVVVEYNKALIESNSRGVVLPYRIVRAVGDIVVVKDVFTRRFQRTSELRELTVQEESK